MYNPNELSLLKSFKSDYVDIFLFEWHPPTVQGEDENVDEDIEAALFEEKVLKVIEDFPIDLKDAYKQLLFLGGGIHWHTIVKYKNPPTHFFNTGFGIVQQYAFIVDTDMGSYHGHITNLDEDHYSDGYWQDLDYGLATRGDYNIHHGLSNSICAILYDIQMTSKLSLEEKAEALRLFFQSPDTEKVILHSNKTYPSLYLPIEGNKDKYEKILTTLPPKQ